MQQYDLQSYAEKTKENKLTLVKYAADWCGPCKALAPMLEELVKNYTDINVGEVNIDHFGELAINDGIRGVPTVVFYKNGQLLDKMVGLHPAKTYATKIDSLK